MIILFSGYSKKSELIFSDFNGTDEGVISIKNIRRYFDGKNVSNEFKESVPKFICLSSWRNGDLFNPMNKNHFKSLNNPDVMEHDDNYNMPHSYHEEMYEERNEQKCWYIPKKKNR